MQATSDERIARAQLNQLMGEPLSATFALDPTPSALAIDITDPASLEEEALKNRPDVALAMQQEQLAAATRGRGAGGVSAAGGGAGRLGTQWRRLELAVLELGRRRRRADQRVPWLADKARLAEAREQATRRAFETSKAETTARLDVHIAIARLDAARASETVGRAAADQARESRRIIRDRYESGLTDAAMLLRAAEAVLQADTQQIAAQVAVLTETATLERAIGRP